MRKPVTVIAIQGIDSIGPVLLILPTALIGFPTGYIIREERIAVSVLGGNMPG